jgi:hypothetical protein
MQDSYKSAKKLLQHSNTVPSVIRAEAMTTALRHNKGMMKIVSESFQSLQELAGVQRLPDGMFEHKKITI